jgi:hypothetical protein
MPCELRFPFEKFNRYQCVVWCRQEPWPVLYCVSLHWQSKLLITKQYLIYRTVAAVSYCTSHPQLGYISSTVGYISSTPGYISFTTRLPLIKTSSQLHEYPQLGYVSSTSGDISSTLCCVSSTTCLLLIHSGYVSSTVEVSYISSTTRLPLTHNRLHLIHSRLHLIHNSATSYPKSSQLHEYPQLGYVSSTSGDFSSTLCCVSSTTSILLIHSGYVSSTVAVSYISYTTRLTLTHN